MPVNKKYLADFLPDEYYHVYNRTNNKESLFRDDEDKDIFLQLIYNLLSPYLSIRAYCLMDNHFHFLIKTRSMEEVERNMLGIHKGELRIVQLNFLLSKNKGEDEFNKLIIHQFKKVFISYTMRFNKVYERKGNLFGRSFKRVQMAEIDTIKYVFFYIHSNPLVVELVDSFEDYAWSSYEAIVRKNDNIIEFKEALRMFGGIRSFKEYHDVMLEKLT